ncbi:MULTISPECIES: phosphatidylinositol phosphate synthase [Nesterenkonia]|uniref:Phosphatidylinositol phosphate synthase n=2 Tax=Nesterenkonia TaxID=57494 RepID=A0A0W8ID94_9MICC|nr:MULTISPECIES: CDP-alcohol phosphatidyltransferase family protein [Nesterenkonia]KUG57922.1 CDP-alcohol phosphatidyltransferase [Nesterenkonia jeotgali]MBA8920669.1 CDP-diacylglycerol--glycerol-3-phosphate 3-phosphatidyltransferase [Nesterenkonia jeotgali]NYJ17753.1 CDP-diacylglycerol--glycerol-3-phosphate 3-phosphatidyltransferase [Nesterenkonia sandarakina]
MLNRYARAFFGGLFTPIAKALLGLGMTPNMVTVIGTIGVCLGALVFYPMGELFWGTVFITVFVFSDLIDGLMARISGQGSVLGGFLDSCLDRVQDGAVFLGLMIWFFTGGDHLWLGIASAFCLLAGSLVSYVRAKAEALGYTADVGIAERSERMVLTLVFTGFTGLGLHPSVLLIVLVLLGIASVVTIAQRFQTVIRQTAAATD